MHYINNYGAISHHFLVLKRVTKKQANFQMREFIFYLMHCIFFYLLAAIVCVQCFWGKKLMHPLCIFANLWANLCTCFVYFVGKLVLFVSKLVHFSCVFCGRTCIVFCTRCCTLFTIVVQTFITIQEGEGGFSPQSPPLDLPWVSNVPPTGALL